MAAFGNDKKYRRRSVPRKTTSASNTTTLILLGPWGGRGWYASAPSRGRLSLCADVPARKGGPGTTAGICFTCPSAKLLTKDEARRIAANIARLSERLCLSQVSRCCRVNCLSIQLGLDEKTHGHRKARSITASGYSLSVHVISLIDDAGQLHRNCDQRTYLSHLRPSFGLSRAGDRGRHRECRKQPGI